MSLPNSSIAVTAGSGQTGAAHLVSGKKYEAWTLVTVHQSLGEIDGSQIDYTFAFDTGDVNAIRPTYIYSDVDVAIIDMRMTLRRNSPGVTVPTDLPIDIIRSPSSITGTPNQTVQMAFDGKGAKFDPPGGTFGNMFVSDPTATTITGGTTRRLMSISVQPGQQTITTFDAISLTMNGQFHLCPPFLPGLFGAFSPRPFRILLPINDVIQVQGVIGSIQMVVERMG